MQQTKWKTGKKRTSAMAKIDEEGFAGILLCVFVSCGRSRHTDKFFFSLLPNEVNAAEKICKILHTT